MSNSKTALGLLFFALVFPGLASTAVAGPKFDRVMEMYQGGAPVLEFDLAGESAWAGYCIHPTDRIDDSMIALRHTNDPVMGPSLKSYQAQTLGSANYYLRMDEPTARAEIDKTDPSLWDDGIWSDGDLYSRRHERFETVLRKALSSGIKGAYFVAAKRCRSLDGIKCNGSGSLDFIVYEACYFYSRKF